MITAQPAHILVCSLGASWAVIPEILGWLAPQLLDLYAHHPNLKFHRSSGEFTC